MSLPLIDLRAKITAEADAVPEAAHRATGKQADSDKRARLRRANI